MSFDVIVAGFIRKALEGADWAGDALASWVGLAAFLEPAARERSLGEQVTRAPERQG